MRGRFSDSSSVENFISTYFLENNCIPEWILNFIIIVAIENCHNSKSLLGKLGTLEHRFSEWILYLISSVKHLFQDVNFGTTILPVLKYL